MATRNNKWEKLENSIDLEKQKAANGIESPHDILHFERNYAKTSTETVRFRRDKNAAKESENEKVKIIPLGGLNEIGKNLTVYEYEDQIVLVDCGLKFPDSDMPGVDMVIPDFTYLEKNAGKISALLVTHGHEDHIGAIPYLLKRIKVPIYATRLTVALIEGKLKEHNLLGSAEIHIVHDGDTIDFGKIRAEFIHVNHSIPDAVAVALFTPAGTIVHTGDFKVDFTPIEGKMIDLGRFSQLGEQGVLALLADSTNAERPGATMTERRVGASFRSLFRDAAGKRIIIATFASNIHRIQQIMDCAEEFGRKVAVSGRSMESAVQIALELGYLKAKDGLIITLDEMYRYRSEEIVLITTGSQGEPMAALSRMATGDHRKVGISSSDFIIISATPIPGNEKHVTRVVNDLLKLGAEVIYEGMYEVHVSGHACQDELRMLQSLIKPKYFIPIHGEYKHLRAHARIAAALGTPQENIYIGEIGDVIEVSRQEMRISGTVDAGRVLVDGLGVGDVGSIVLRDRRHLAQDGLIIVVVTIESVSGMILSGPDIVSRGFVYVREAEELIEEARAIVRSVLENCLAASKSDWSTIKLRVRDELSAYIFKQTKRTPMILPIIMEI